MEKKFKAVRVGSSNSNYYQDLKKAHEEFEKMLANGWQVTNAKKTRRPRIQKAKTPRKVVISVLGNKTTVTYQEYLDRCQDFKIVMEIF